jgi:uncharacterized protein (DUF433 family)
MALLEPLIADPPPLTMDAAGTVRVGQTRVTLETVVGAWRDGATAEDVAAAYDTLALADVYAVIGYYLRHASEVDAYLTLRGEHADRVRQALETTASPADLRARLAVRRSPAAPV